MSRQAAQTLLRGIPNRKTGMSEMNARPARYNLDFTGKLVVITGINGGFGSAIAEAFTQCGATVVGIDLTAGNNDPYPTYRANVAKSVEVASAFAAIEEAHGLLDILINNAGIREVKTVYDIEPDEWDKVVSVNLNGVFYCAREAALRMRRKGGGSIINTGSAASVMALTHRPAYVATKTAVLGLTRQLALDLAPDGIRVNVVSPGAVRTPLSEAYYADPEYISDLEATVPLGASGTTDDVADAFLFLASPLSAFVNGHSLLVDGGFTAVKSFSYRKTAGVFTNAGASTT
jgi:NAD(P)-dependent dehydrogenase (short-subunit alcohol dehydrogenase family)